MAPFNVVIRDVPDEGLAGLLNHLAQAGFSRPMVTPADDESPTTTPPGEKRVMTDLPAEWRLVNERSGVSYAWPQETDDYDRYRIFAGTKSAGSPGLR